MASKSTVFIVASALFALVSLPAAAQESPQIEDMLTRAAKLVNSGNLQKGTQLYKDVLAQSPENVNALYSLVQLADAVQDFYDVVLYGKAYLALAVDDIDLPEIQKKVERATEKLVNPGKLRIQVYPDGATIKLNGLLMGKGNLDICLRPQTTFTLEAAYPDHVVFNSDITLALGDDKLISKRLEKITYFGDLEIKLKPAITGVDVYVDAAKAGTDLFQHKLVEGKHLICFSRPGYDRWWRYVEIPRNDKFALDVELFETSEPEKPCNVMPGIDLE